MGGQKKKRKIKHIGVYGSSCKRCSKAPDASSTDG